MATTGRGLQPGQGTGGAGLGARGSPGEAPDRTDAAWRKVLLEGHEQLRFAQRAFRRLPSAPRCKLCHNPFAGPGGRILGLFGFSPSRKNPRLCARCCDRLPPGGLEVDVAVLFADIRESTALCERVGTAAFAGLINRFYQTATEVLVRHDAIVDKLIGDEVMALFVPGFAGPGYRRTAAEAAIDLVSALSSETGLPTGAAVNAGPAYVGNVGGQGVVDFTAVGDTVNAAARLQGMAAAGEVVLADEVYEAALEAGVAGGAFDSRALSARATSLAVRGRTDPVAVHVLRVGVGG